MRIEVLTKQNILIFYTIFKGLVLKKNQAATAAIYLFFTPTYLAPLSHDTVQNV